MKFTVTALLILCHSICLAEDLPETKKNSRSWSAEKPTKIKDAHPLYEPRAANSWDRK